MMFRFFFAPLATACGLPSGAAAGQQAVEAAPLLSAPQASLLPGAAGLTALCALALMVLAAVLRKLKK